MASILTPIRSCFGVEELGPEEIGAARRDRRLVDGLIGAIEEWGRDYEVPAVPQGEVRPFVNARWTHAAKLMGGVPYERTFSRLGRLLYELEDETDADRAVRMLTHHLLYVHGVALEDPITGPTWFDLARRLGPEAALLGRVAAGLSLLVALSPLIDDGIVVVTPKLPTFDHRLHTDVQSIANTYVEEGGEDWLGDLPREVVSRAGVDRDDRLFRGLRLGQLGLSVAEGLGAVDHYGERVHLYLSHPVQHEILNLVVRRGAAALRKAAGSADIEMEYLPDLVSAVLPAIEGEAVRAADIIAIRRNGEFERWRSALRRGLADVSRRPLGADRLDGYVLKDLRNAVADEAHRAAESVRKSGFMGAASRSSVSLTVGAGVSLGLLLTGNLVGAAMATLSPVARLVTEWLRQESVGGDRAVLRHTALFEGSTSV